MLLGILAALLFAAKTGLQLFHRLFRGIRLCLPGRRLEEWVLWVSGHLAAVLQNLAAHRLCVIKLRLHVRQLCLRMQAAQHAAVHKPGAALTYGAAAAAAAFEPSDGA